MMDMAKHEKDVGVVFKFHAADMQYITASHADAWHVRFGCTQGMESNNDNNNCISSNVKWKSDVIVVVCELKAVS